MGGWCEQTDAAPHRVFTWKFNQISVPRPSLEYSEYSSARSRNLRGRRIYKETAGNRTVINFFIYTVLIIIMEFARELETKGQR